LGFNVASGTHASRSPQQLGSEGIRVRQQVLLQRSNDLYTELHLTHIKPAGHFECCGKWVCLPSNWRAWNLLVTSQGNGAV
jgi:hypothetical protein